MNRKTLLSVGGGILILAVFVARIVLRSMRNSDSKNTQTEQVQPAASIEGFDSHTLKVGQTQRFSIALKGLTCNSLRVSSSGIGISLRKAEGDCDYEISGSKPATGYLQVRGAGRVLVDSFAVQVVE